MEQEGNKDRDPIPGLPPGESTPDPVTVTPNQAPPSDEEIQEAHAAQEAYLSRNRYNDPDYQQAAQQALRNYELSPETYRNMFPNDLETLGRMQSWRGLAGQSYVGRIGTQKETSDKNPEESNLIDTTPLPKVRIPLTPVDLDSLGINSSQLDIAQQHVTESNRFVLISMILLGLLAVTIIFMASKLEKLYFNLEIYRQENSFLKSHNKFLNEQLDAANLEIFKLTHKEQENAKSK